MTADLSALIARLEAAEVGDQDLSLEVNIALEGGEPVGKTANYVMEPYWAIRRPNPAYVGGFENGPNYPVTTSLDAALALAERVHGEAYALALLQDLVDLNDTASLAIRDLPRLLCSFTLRAKLDGYEVNKNPKAQEG